MLGTNTFWGNLWSEGGKNVTLDAFMGTEFISKVFNKGVYTVKVRDPGSNKWETIEGLKGIIGSKQEILNVKFD